MKSISKKWSITPDGKLIDSGWSHIEFAREYVKKNNLEGDDYDTMILHSNGWVKVSYEPSLNRLSIFGGCVSPGKIMRNTMMPTMNGAQLRTAKQLCRDYECELLDALNQ